MFSDEILLERLVLKGGNALELVHGVVSRGSVDVDLSMADAFSDLDDTRERIFKALRDEFASVGYLVFDETFRVVPSELVDDLTPWWGGYKVEFKLIDARRAKTLAGNRAKMQIQAEPVDEKQGKKFTIDISKHEYCEGKVLAELDGRTIYVYTEEMCVVEKFRAICQQIPEYGRTVPRPRARDFYDIYSTVNRRALDLALPENLDLFRHIFGAKRVPLKFLARIAETRDFHETDWDAVRQAVVGEVFDFGIYFDFVVNETSRLHSLWKE